MRLRINGNETIATLLPDEHPPIRLHDDAFRRAQPRSDGLDGSITP